MTTNVNADKPAPSQGMEEHPAAKRLRDANLDPWEYAEYEGKPKRLKTRTTWCLYPWVMDLIEVARIHLKGESQARQRITALEQQVAALTAENHDLHRQCAAMATALDDERQDFCEKREEFDRMLGIACEGAEENLARATAAESARDEAVKRLRVGLLGVEELERMRETLERIGTEYPSVSGPITCPPSPHACPKCEIQFLLDAALRPASDQVKPDETDVATLGNDA